MNETLKPKFRGVVDRDLDDKGHGGGCGRRRSGLLGIGLIGGGGPVFHHERGLRGRELVDLGPRVHLEGCVDVVSELGHLLFRREVVVDGGVNVAKLQEFGGRQFRAQDLGQAGLDELQLLDRTTLALFKVEVGGDGGDDGEDVQELAVFAELALNTCGGGGGEGAADGGGGGGGGHGQRNCHEGAGCNITKY